MGLGRMSCTKKTSKETSWKELTTWPWATNWGQQRTQHPLGGSTLDGEESERTKPLSHSRHKSFRTNVAFFDRSQIPAERLVGSPSKGAKSSCENVLWSCFPASPHQMASALTVPMLAALCHHRHNSIQNGPFSHHLQPLPPLHLLLSSLELNLSHLIFEWDGGL